MNQKTYKRYFRDELITPKMDNLFKYANCFPPCSNCESKKKKK